MKISQHLLAEMAGVSRGTVDRVLHGRPNVKPETREKVLEAIEKLNYSPNTVGRALALSNRTYTICVVVPDVPFFSDVFAGIRTAEAELSDYNLSFEYIITTCMDTGEIVQAIDENQSMAIMAAVTDSPEIRECIRRKTEKGIPVVTFNTDVQDCGRLCFVGQALYKSGRIAASLMLKMMQEKQNSILIVTGQKQFQAHRARVQGFTDAITESGRSITLAGVVETNDERTLTDERMREALAKNPDIDGIYMASGHMEACVNVLREAEKKYHVVVNDLSPVIETALKQNIFDFTIFQNPFEQGYRPVKILFDFLFNGQNPMEEFYYTDNMIITSEMLD